ncbi:hypothetical protein IV102_00510 [bacterium]|nr:hypothetical protein [bacterium]
MAGWVLWGWDLPGARPGPTADPAGLAQAAFAHFQKAGQRPVALMSMLSFALTPFFQSRPDVG